MKDTQSVPTVSDMDLVEATRSGDESAYGQLWERHHGAGVRVASKITDRFDPEDLTAEAFARTLGAIQRGQGPTEAFRPYLYASIRSISMNWARRDDKEVTREESTPEIDPDSLFEDELLDRTITGRAFASLRPEWRSVLWYVEVEGMSTGEVAELLGIAPSAAAALAYRAREGLRTQWLQSHIADDKVSEDCRRTSEKLGAYSRGKLSRAQRNQVQDHLTGCIKCSILADEVDEVAERLRIVLLPLIVGPGIATIAVPGAAAGTSLGADAGATHHVRHVSKAGASATVAAGFAAVVAAVAFALNSPGTDADAVVTEDVAAPAITSPTASPDPTDGDTLPGTTSSPAANAESGGDSDAEAPVTGAEPGETSQSDESVGTRAAPAAPAGVREPSVSAAATTPERESDLSSAPTPVPSTTPSPTPAAPAPPAPAPPPAPSVPDAPVIASAQSDTYFETTVRGRGAAGTEIILESASGRELARTTVADNGEWAVTVQPQASERSLTVKAYAELDGLRSDASSSLDLPEFKTVRAHSFRARADEFSFDLDGVAGKTVEVLLDGVSVNSAVVLTGTTNRVVLAPLATGRYELQTRYVDPATGRHGQLRTFSLSIQNSLP